MERSLPLFTNLPKNQSWWLWAFLAWLFFSMGPGLEWFGSRAVFIGPFPWLYLLELLWFVMAIILIYFLCYRLDFCDINDDQIQRIINESEEEKHE